MLKWIPSSSHVEGRASIKAADSEFMSGAFVCFFVCGWRGGGAGRTFSVTAVLRCVLHMRRGLFSFELPASPEQDRSCGRFLLLHLTDGLLRRPIFSFLFKKGKTRRAQSGGKYEER